MTDAPTTAPEAAARLNTLTADPAWGQKLMARDVATVKEFNDLTGLVAKADTAAEALAGRFSTPSIAGAELLGVGIEQLRQVGLSDEIIKSVLDGQPVSKTEHEAVRRMQTQKMNDKGWVEKLLNGDADIKREFTLMSVVLAADIKQEKAT